MYAHPGKKLNFMGSELAQFREWDEKREQDWDILKYPMHDGFMHFMKKLCNMYLEIPSLSRWDDAPEGFRWLDCDSALKRCYTMLRSCDGGAPGGCGVQSLRPRAGRLRTEHRAGQAAEAAA